MCQLIHQAILVCLFSVLVCNLDRFELWVLIAAFQISAYIEIDVQTYEQQGEATYLDYSNLKVRKDAKTKTRKIYGNITQHIALDNSYMAEAYVYVKQGGEYRLLPYKVPAKGFCDFNNDDVYYYPEFSGASDYPMPYPCPCPAVRISIVWLSCSIWALFIIVFIYRELMRFAASVLRWRTFQLLSCTMETTRVNY